MITAMIEVSVIVPTYNRQARLKKALGSILCQEGLCFEVIVIDDGSTDGTGEMVREDFPSVDYCYQKNQGPAAARNRGIEKCRGEWIAFLDSDDEWLPGKLKAQMEFLTSHPTPHLFPPPSTRGEDRRGARSNGRNYLICQTEEIWIRNGRRVNPMNKHKKYGGWIFEKCLPLCIISPSSVMIHRGIFDEVGIFDESYPACEDYELWLRIASRFPVGLIEKPYVTKYGGHEDQRSREFPAMDRFRIQALIKILRSGTLPTNLRAAALKELQTKAEIFCQGAKRHGNEREAEEIQEIIAEL